MKVTGKETLKEGYALRPVLLTIGLSFAALPLAWHASWGGQAPSASLALYLCLIGIMVCAVEALLRSLAARRRHAELLSAYEAAHSLLQNRLMAIEASQEGVAIINPFSQLTYMNNALFNIYGIPAEAEDQFIGENWLRLFPEDQAKFVSEKALAAIEREGFWTGPVELRLDGGNVQRLDIALSRLPDGGLICTTRDVTERHKNEREKKQLEEQFYQAQKMEAVGRLAGGIAHDFNNILAAIGGYAEFLEEDLEEGSQQQDFAKKILKAGWEAKTLVDQMLAFSRRKDSVMEPVDLAVSLRETVSILNASLPKSIEIEQTYDAPGAVIGGNASQIMQVFMNLCVNARDAIDTNKGTIGIGLSLKTGEDFPLAEARMDDFPDPREQPPTWIEDMAAGKTRLVLGRVAKGQAYAVVRISDTGSGMSRIVMEHIFEPFFTTKPVNKGTGLGMATVHGLLTGHRGAMVIESTLGRGTVFDLYFPASGQKISAAAEADKKNGRTAQSKAATILLVEDQETVRDMMINMLARLGYTVETCPSGLEALDRVRESPGAFDLVITDESMPKMSGTELVHQVHYDFPGIPFIMLTGYTKQQLEDIAQNHPAIRAILKKPVTRDALAREIAAVLDSKRAGATVGAGS